MILKSMLLPPAPPLDIFLPSPEKSLRTPMVMTPTWMNFQDPAVSFYDHPKPGCHKRFTDRRIIEEQADQLIKVILGWYDWGKLTLELSELISKPSFFRLRVADGQHLRDGLDHVVLVALEAASLEDLLHLLQGEDQSADVLLSLDIHILDLWRNII